MRDVHGESGGAWTSSHPLTGERIAAQPAIKPDEAAVLCPSPEARTAQVRATRAAIRVWIEQAAERQAAAEKVSQENQRDTQEAAGGELTCWRMAAPAIMPACPGAAELPRSDWRSATSQRVRELRSMIPGRSASRALQL
jgi:predicted Zn-dependent protease